MGLDLYMHWPGMNEAEKALQLAGLRVLGGKVGYLHEDYHGPPYALKHLATEAFMDDTFCTCSGALAGTDRCDHCLGVPFSADALEERLPRTLELAAERERRIYNRLDATDVLDSIRDFVALARRKEEELGEPVRIYARY